jgi:Fe-S-cluster containining protein
MPCYQDGDLVLRVLERYREIDRMTTATILATRLRCPHRCGKCCQSRKVYATVLECLPLAEYLYSIGDEEKILAEIEEKIKDDDGGCILYRPDRDNPDHGRCSNYAFRPLVCRLFGIALRRNKFNKKELSLCKVIKGMSKVSIELIAEEDSTFPTFPVYQDSFMGVASLHPGIGYQAFPINSAIKQAVEYLYWKYPRRFRRKKAA